MTATTVLVTLLLAPAASGGAPPAAACEIFTRSSEALPALVREWFGHSGDERVVICPQTGASGSARPPTLYFGEGALTQQGRVCTYPRHGLTLTGAGAAAHLLRYDRSEALAMSVAGAECPAPHAATSTQGYVETYDIGTSTFLGIMHAWSAIATSSALPASGTGGARGAQETRVRVQAVLGSRASSATVTRIVRIPGSVLRHRFALFVKAPDAAAGATAQYVIYVDKYLRGPYEFTAFAETN